MNIPAVESQTRADAGLELNNKTSWQGLKPSFPPCVCWDLGEGGALGYPTVNKVNFG